MATKHLIAYIPQGYGGSNTNVQYFGALLSDATVDTDWTTCSTALTLGAGGAAVDWAQEVVVNFAADGLTIITSTPLTVAVQAPGLILGTPPPNGIVVQNITGDGAITLGPTALTRVILSKASAAAITLAAPTAGVNDGQEILVTTSTADAHVITSSVDGFNAKGSSGTATFAAAIGNSLRLMAFGGHWYAIVKSGVTIA